MNFRVFHLYDRLADRGQVPTLSCLTDGQDLSLQADSDMEPVLVCYFCDSTITPGLNLYEELLEKVREFYPDFEEE